MAGNEAYATHRDAADAEEHNKSCSTFITCESLLCATCCTRIEFNTTVERHGGKRNALWPPQRAPISNRVTGKPAHRIRGVLACLLCFFQCCITIKATNTIGQPVSTLRSPYCNSETSDLGDSHANDPTVPSCTVETEAGQRRVLSCLLLDYEIGRYDRSGMPVSYLPDTDGWSLCMNFKNEAGV